MGHNAGDNWWSDRDPRKAWRLYAAPIPGESLIETGFRLGTGALRSVSPYNLILGYQWKKGRSDGYVLGWFVALLLAAALINMTVAAAAIIVLATAVVRLLDLYAYHLGVVMVDMRRQKEELARDHFALIERRIMFLLLDVGQAIICFGLMAQALARLWPAQFIFETSRWTRPQNTFDFIYMAWGQMLTVNSKFEPVTGGAEAVHMLTVGGGIVLIVMVLSYVISRVRPIA
jgi:hypothetical protein